MHSLGGYARAMTPEEIRAVIAKLQGELTADRPQDLEDAAGDFARDGPPLWLLLPSFNPLSLTAVSRR
jgi:hypothetical protein